MDLNIPAMIVVNSLPMLQRKSATERRPTDIDRITQKNT